MSIINTKGLYQGQYRRLTKEEINDLYDLVNKKFTKYVESSTGDENGKVYNATFVRDEITINVVFVEK